MGGDIFSEESGSDNELPEEENAKDEAMTLEQMAEKGWQLIAADRADTPPIYIYTDPFPESESRNDYINNRNYNTESLERFNLMYHAANNRITQNPDKVTLHGYIQPRNVQHDRLRIGTWLHALKTKTMKKGRRSYKYYKILYALYILPQGEKIVLNCYD